MDVELLLRLLSIPGVSGFEEGIAEAVADLSGGAADDGLGAMVAGRGRVAFLAHMDEVGLLAARIREDGKVEARAVGGVEEAALKGVGVRAYGHGFDLSGVVDGTEDAQGPVADFGFSSKEDAAAAGLRPMTPTAFSRRPTVDGRRVISAALDDRAGVWALLEALKEGAGARFIWTVQEELESLGVNAKALDGVKLAVVVDAVPCCTDGVRTGGGAVVVALDDYGLYLDRRARRIVDLAERAGVAVQVGPAAGGSDAAAARNLGVPAVYMGCPSRTCTDLRS